MGFQWLLAAGFEEQVKEAQSGSINTREWLLGLGVALAIGFIIVLCVYWRSRSKSDRQDRERLAQITRGQNSSRGSRDHSDAAEDDIDAGSPRRRKKRRRRREHRARNPSLSETGGLPPPRPDDQLPKY